MRSVGPTLGPPKTPAAHRSVTLPAGTVDVLREHMTQFVDGGQDARIFTSVKGSPLLYRYFAPFWNRAKEAAEIDPEVHFHDLRHLASNTAASSGASVKDLMARMGHATSDASLRYLQASARRDGEIARRMQEQIAPAHSSDT